MLLNDARQQITDACSHLSDDGLVVGTAGNLSVREGDLVAITPSGLPYQDMRPDLVAVVDYATGRQVEGPLKPASELDLHLTALRATGQMSVVHTHSYAATTDPAGLMGAGPMRLPLATWATHGEDFVAAVENGALCATQFHPEKSGDAGAQLLRNWLTTL